ncbi:BON domain-containing protein [Tautonia sociabilis]|uniref:BON domain-containing protein n=1 Tax=Tautonia sociabilis TaxID=2080755 RepID=A0A432MQB1_9BACT|nr:BON domain-containing protein [Tautonia sociabilis]RUL89671.1 BON domain-containing protein [Tautonia sociabilis]
MIAMQKRISIASGVLAAVVAAASPALAGDRFSNQQTADSVAAALRSVPALWGQQISIEARDGVVTLSGVVAEDGQRTAAIERARNLAGVSAVVDAIRVGADAGLDQTQYQIARGGHLPGTVMDGSYLGGAPAMDGATYVGDAGMGGPMPEGPAGFGGATQASTPGYPNYAWPSYAPYPNFSAVGYPTAYPWQAWPNIGPFYPYPEVPLDWRAVTLRWDDGIWFLDFKKHYTRPFFTPYPFGLFAY